MCKPSQSVKQAKLNKQNIENTKIVGFSEKVDFEKKTVDKKRQKHLIT